MEVYQTRPGHARPANRTFTTAGQVRAKEGDRGLPKTANPYLFKLFPERIEGEIMIELDEKWTSLFKEKDPCDWPRLGWYLYGRKYKKLPPKCKSCWKPLAFFDDEKSFQVFCHRLMGPAIRRSLRFEWKPIERGVVAYAGSRGATDKIRQKFKKIADEAGIRGRFPYRHAGRYWQDLFPEFFGRQVNRYQPFNPELFEFRKIADKLESLYNASRSWQRFESD